ncbi:MAG TPA: hypothetical protein PKY81_11570 [bacterium]|nr:hypothetical protein [bacterium]
MIRERGEGYFRFMPVKKEVESFIKLLKYGFEIRSGLEIRKSDKEAEKIEKKSNSRKNK